MGVILWLSDLHLDPYYGSDAAASHKAGTNCSLPENATILEHPYGRVGCDTPITLLDFAMANAAANHNSKIKIDFVLITGDFSRHSMERLSGSVYDHVEFVLTACIDSIQRALPNVPILPVLGNNDVVPDYYLGEQFDSADDGSSLDDQQEELPHNDAADDMPDPQTMLDSVAFGLKDAFGNHDELFFFSQGGYFSRRVPLDSQRAILVLSLNTVLYSTRHEPYIKGQDQDPYGQFKWMKSQLQMVATSNTNSTANTSSRIVGVYLAGHIPPSVGSYRHSQLWRDEYLQEFSTILQDYTNGKYNTLPSANQSPPPILGHFYGHVHTEEFRLLRYESHPTQEQEDSNNNIHNATQGANNNHTTIANDPLVVPVLVTSSITPIYGANPSYRLVEYNETTGALVDYKTHYLDLDRTATNLNAGNAAASSSQNNPWIELPTFVQAYGVPDLSLDSFQSLFESLEGEMMQATRAELCGGDDEKPNNSGSTTTNSSTTNGNSRTFPLWETFWRRQNLYSTSPDDGDDDNGKSQTAVMVDWLCTFGASSAQDHNECLAAKQSDLVAEKLCGGGGSSGSNGSTSNPPGDKDGGNPPSKLSLSLGGKGTPFVAVTTAVAIFGIVLLAVAVRNCTRRVSKRKLYSVPQQDHNDEGHEEEEEADGVFAVDGGLPAEPEIEIT